MPTVHCNNEECTHNDGDKRICICEEIYYTMDGCCVSYRRRPRDDIEDLMRPPIRTGCHREQGKWKADTGRTIK